MKYVSLKYALSVYTLVLVIVLAFGGCIFDYNLEAYFGKDIPWYFDCLAGVVVAPVNVTAAVVAFVMIECDVPHPICFPDEE